MHCVCVYGGGSEGMHVCMHMRVRVCVVRE